MQGPHRKYEEHSYEDVEKSFGDIDPEQQDSPYFPSEEFKPLHY